jgi:dTDP-4-amino-4,6-dideoxygalactose transaminase
MAEGLSGIASLRLPNPPADIRHAYYKFYVFVRPALLAPGWDRDRVMAEVNAQGVPCSVGSCSEIYLEKAFRDRGWGPDRPLPVATELGQTSLMFVVHPTLSDEAVGYAIETIRSVMGRATGDARGAA